MEVIKECQRLALKCRKLEMQRVEILQNAADEISRLNQQITFLGKLQCSSGKLWTKAMKSSIDKFAILSWNCDYNDNQYVSTTEYVSYSTYNRMLSDYRRIRQSNILLMSSVNKELLRLQFQTQILTNDIIYKYDRLSMAYCKQIVAGYVSSHLIGGQCSYYKYQSIICEINRFYRSFEISLINHFYNSNQSRMFDNLLLQKTWVNKQRNFAHFMSHQTHLQKTSEMVVIDDILCKSKNDQITISFKIAGYCAIGFMQAELNDSMNISSKKKRKRNKKREKKKSILITNHANLCLQNQSKYVLLNWFKQLYSDKLHLFNDIDPNVHRKCSDNDDCIDLEYDPFKVFSYECIHQKCPRFYSGTHEVCVTVNMSQLNAKITVINRPNDEDGNANFIEYYFHHLPEKVYFVVRTRMGDRIAIL